MMSRTYKVWRNESDFSGVRKEWVLVNKRGAKKFQRMVNKRCRRLDKIAIAEGINEMIDDIQEVILEELSYDWYEEDFGDWDDVDPFEDLWEEELEDDYLDSEEDLFEEVEYDYEDYPDPFFLD